MKKSKYLGNTFYGWTCTKVNVAYVMPVFKKGTKVRSLRPHHQCYSYTMEGRLLGQTVRIVLNFSEAAKMYRGKFDPTIKLLKGNSDVCVVMK